MSAMKIPAVLIPSSTYCNMTVGAGGGRSGEAFERRRKKKNGAKNLQSVCSTSLVDSHVAGFKSFVSH